MLQAFDIARDDTMPSMTIGRLAANAGVNIDTIRYYERHGLLPAPVRRSSGYRQYDTGAVARLKFIRRAKELGFTLAEIGELLSLHGDADMRSVKSKAEERLRHVEARIKDLQRVKRGLKTLIAACPGHGALERCPIMSALGGSNGDE
jgi:MerR family copper efflux transcriptional regulator